MKNISFRFDCPHCQEPWASPVEDNIDIHSGTVYTCADCNGKVIFTVQTPDEYSYSCLATVVTRDGGLSLDDLKELCEV